MTFIYPKNGPINNFDQKIIEMKNLVLTFTFKIVLGCLQQFLGPKEDTIIDYMFLVFQVNNTFKFIPATCTSGFLSQG